MLRSCLPRLLNVSHSALSRRMRSLQSPHSLRLSMRFRYTSAGPRRPESDGEKTSCTRTTGPIRCSRAHPYGMRRISSLHRGSETGHKCCRFAGCDRAHLTQADFGNHALKACTRHRPSRGPSKVLVDDLDLTRPQLSQPCFHRILQLLALQVMNHLIWRRLTNVKNRLAFQMLCANLLTHRPPPFARGDEDPSRGVRSSSGSTGEASADRLPAAPAAVASSEQIARPVCL